MFKYFFDVPCTQFRRYTDHNTRKNTEKQFIIKMLYNLLMECKRNCWMVLLSSQSSFVPGVREAAGFLKIKCDLLSRLVEIWCSLQSGYK